MKMRGRDPVLGGKRIPKGKPRPRREKSHFDQRSLACAAERMTAGPQHERTKNRFSDPRNRFFAFLRKRSDSVPISPCLVGEETGSDRRRKRVGSETGASRGARRWSLRSNLGAGIKNGVILSFPEPGVISGRESRPENGGPSRPDRRTFFGKFLVRTGLFGDSQCRPTRVISRGAVIRIPSVMQRNACSPPK